MSRGYSALAITDECSLAGVVRAHTALREIKQERERQQKEREDKAKAAQAGSAFGRSAKPERRNRNSAETNKTPTKDRGTKTAPSPDHRQRTQSDRRYRRALLHTGCARNQPQRLRQSFRTDHAGPLARGQRQLSPRSVRLHRFVAPSRASKNLARLRPDARAAAHGDALAYAALRALARIVRCATRVDRTRTLANRQRRSSDRRLAHDFKSERFAAGRGRRRSHACPIAQAACRTR